jgi:hypothetical protein
MKWYHYLACFFAGMFLANSVPHFIHGISGELFPTPFAHPSGKGLSSPTINVIWGLGNLAVGYILFNIGKVSKSDWWSWSWVIFFIGIIVMSIFSSFAFSQII